MFHGCSEMEQRSLPRDADAVSIYSDPDSLLAGFEVAELRPRGSVPAAPVPAAYGDLREDLDVLRFDALQGRRRGRARKRRLSKKGGARGAWEASGGRPGRTPEEEETPPSTVEDLRDVINRRRRLAAAASGEDGCGVSSTGAPAESPQRPPSPDGSCSSVEELPFSRPPPPVVDLSDESEPEAQADGGHRLDRPPTLPLMDGSVDPRRPAALRPTPPSVPPRLSARHPWQLPADLEVWSPILGVPVETPVPVEDSPVMVIKEESAHPQGAGQRPTRRDCEADPGPCSSAGHLGRALKVEKLEALEACRPPELKAGKAPPVVVDLLSEESDADTLPLPDAPAKLALLRSPAKRRVDFSRVLSWVATLEKHEWPAKGARPNASPPLVVDLLSDDESDNVAALPAGAQRPQQPCGPTRAAPTPPARPGRLGAFPPAAARSVGGPSGSGPRCRRTAVSVKVEAPGSPPAPRGAAVMQQTRLVSTSDPVVVKAEPVRPKVEPGSRPSNLAVPVAVPLKVSEEMPVEGPAEVPFEVPFEVPVEVPLKVPVVVHDEVPVRGASRSRRVRPGRMNKIELVRNPFYSHTPEPGRRRVCEPPSLPVARGDVILGPRRPAQRSVGDPPRPCPNPRPSPAVPPLRPGRGVGRGSNAHRGAARPELGPRPGPCVLRNPFSHATARCDAGALTDNESVPRPDLGH